MADLSGLHPLVRDALRTGRIPDNEAIARALGRDPQEIARSRELVERETAAENESADAEPEHPDAQRFRDRYHQLVDAMTAEWLGEHPEYGKRVPAGVRERIAGECNCQIQHAWRLHRQRLDEEPDEQDA